MYVCERETNCVYVRLTACMCLCVCVCVCVSRSIPVLIDYTCLDPSKHVDTPSTQNVYQLYFVKLIKSSISNDRPQ